MRFNPQMFSTAMKLLPLLCLCLLTRSGTTFADEDGPVIFKVKEGSDVTLPCFLSTKQNIEGERFEWKKDGQKEVFFFDAGIVDEDQQFKGRVSHFDDELQYGNASIIIRNTKVADSGDYSCVFPNLQPSPVLIQLVVEPVVVIVKEDSDAILPCSLSTKQNIGSAFFDWKKKEQENKEVFMYNNGTTYGPSLAGQDQQFKGRVSHFQDELKYGNASIKINNTKLADSGDYSCDFPHLQPRQTFYIQLVVGASPEPYVTILNQTKDGMLLQCDVRGASPKPTVKWQNSAGNKLLAEEPQVSERGGRFYISLQTTVKKTDRYRCVATQENISHQIEAEIYVPVNGAAAEPSFTILGQTNDGVLLQCEVLNVSPKPKLEWMNSSGKVLPAKEPQVSERGGRFYITLQTTVTKTDHYRCVATQEGISQPMYTETYVPVNELTGLVAAVAVLVLALALVVVVAVLYVRHLRRNSLRGPDTLQETDSLKNNP